MATMTEARPLNHAEMTAHIRKRLRAAGIKAHVRKQSDGGGPLIRIEVADRDPDVRFTDEEQREILIIVSANGLTGARGSAIDINRMTYGWGGVFEFRGPRY